MCIKREICVCECLICKIQRTKAIDISYNKNTNMYDISKGIYCVYFLINNKKVVYIGKTSQFRKRISVHKSSKKYKFDSYYIAYSNHVDYSRHEEILIKSLKPKYNKQHNSN